MGFREKDDPGLFDNWPDKYDNWFLTPLGLLVKKFETSLLLEMLQPERGELILDVGCGTGVFTLDILSYGTKIFGIDISTPMLSQAVKKTCTYPFYAIAGDMSVLPFPDESFDKVYSMTALEFVADAKKAVSELDRVIRPGGRVVLTTLNSLSPWAERRKKEGEKGHTLFKHMIFRSPAELEILAPRNPRIQTAIHFLKEDDPEQAVLIEKEGKKEQRNTGAIVAMSWPKPL
ncbi:MAG: methyltransferase domain-containing protein [Desulfobacterales bacterium]|nr:methyltransferase domain-containing protein [Desulfobacterales bacterium]